MFKLAVRSVRQKPGRLVLTAIAVALGVSLVAATFTFTTALRNGFADLFNDIYGSTDVVVEADPNAQIDSDDPFAASGPVFTDEDVAAVQAVDGVEIAAGGVQLNAQVLPKEEGTQPPFGGTQMFNCRATHAWTSRQWLTDTRPRPMTRSCLMSTAWRVLATR